jgi:hypothetical protein
MHSVLLQYTILHVGDEEIAWRVTLTAACLASVLAVCSEQKTNCHRAKTRYKHMAVLSRTEAEQANRLQQLFSFCGWMVLHLMSCSRLLPLQSLKQILTREKQPLAVSVCTLRYAVWKMRVLLKNWHFLFGQLYCGNCAILSTYYSIATVQYCPQTIQWPLRNNTRQGLLTGHCAMLCTNHSVAMTTVQYCPKTTHYFWDYTI